jgi:predicted amidohydrolase YtcJ
VIRHALLLAAIGTIAVEGGHSAWLNSKVFEVLEINQTTPDPIPGSH